MLRLPPIKALQKAKYLNEPVWMSRRYFNHLDLRGANLARLNMSELEIEHSDLRGTNLQNANLWEARLHGTDLEGADLRGAYLVWTHLGRAKVSNAIYDETTEWPCGFNPQLPNNRLLSLPYQDPANTPIAVKIGDYIPLLKGVVEEIATFDDSGGGDYHMYRVNRRWHLEIYVRPLQ